MGSFSIWHWMIVLVVVILLFGRGKIANVMGDLATGIKSFKRGMADDDATPATPPAAIATGADPLVEPVRSRDRSVLP